MKKLFKTVFFGYNKKQVNSYMLSLRKDYEDELSKRKDRMWEVTAENRELKAKIIGYEERLSQYEEREAFISKAMIKAEENAQSIMQECYYKRDVEKNKIAQEKKKWEIREREIIKQLLDFQNEAYALMESFQSEINYLTSKEVMYPEKEDEQVSKEVDHKEILTASSM